MSINEKKSLVTTATLIFISLKKATYKPNQRSKVNCNSIRARQTHRTNTENKLELENERAIQKKKLEKFKI